MIDIETICRERLEGWIKRLVAANAVPAVLVAHSQGDIVVCAPEGLAAAYAGMLLRYADAQLDPDNIKFGDQATAMREIQNARLRHALEELVKIQRCYATMLNAIDGGDRTEFANAQHWLDRLAESERQLRAAEAPHLIPIKGKT